MANSVFSPAEKYDTELAEDVERAAAAPVARVQDSFDITLGAGQLVRLTLLRVFDPVKVKHFHGGGPQHFPRAWRGDWYDERRYVGVRLRMRPLSDDHKPDLLALSGGLMGVFDPMRLIDHQGSAFRPDDTAWTLGANPIEGDQVRSIVNRGTGKVLGAVFPVPESTRIEYLRASKTIAREWYLGPVATLREALAEVVLGLTSPGQLIRASAMAVAQGAPNGALGPLAERNPWEAGADVAAAFQAGVAKAGVELPSLTESAQILKCAYLREIVAGRVAPGAGVQRIRDDIFPRLEAEIGKEGAWEQLGLNWLFGPYLARRYSEIADQEAKDQLIIETSQKLLKGPGE
ncbi:MAG: hypothetical protein ACT4R6_00970 [Gemmatimonadaceae bacterium]